MPLLFIRTTNSTFTSRDGGAEYDNPDRAKARGIESAVAIAADEVNAGNASAAVEVDIQQRDGTSVLRVIVSTSVMPLLPWEKSYPTVPSPIG